MNAVEALGRVWPQWELLEPLGSGSCGTVYRARRRDMPGAVCSAIKIITLPPDEDEGGSLCREGLSEAPSRGCFERVARDYLAEIDLMSQVRGHANIVSIEDYGICARPDAMLWDIFIRMELLTPLNRYMADRPMDEAAVTRLGMDLCNALETCHRRNIVHRDIKPGNIFVNARGDFKLGDFGASRRLERLTPNLPRRGTFSYMAPEVFHEARIEANVASAARSDLYALGLTLYRLLNGNRLPFLPGQQILTPRDYRDALTRRMGGEPLPPPENASPALGRVILKACRFQPEERYADANAFRAALERTARAAAVSPPEAASPAV